MIDTEKWLQLFTNPLFIIFAGLLAVAGVINLLQRAKSKRAWDELASRIGLTEQAFDRSLWSHSGSRRIERAMAGAYLGREVAIFQYHSQSTISQIGQNKTERRQTTGANIQVIIDQAASLSIQPYLALGKKPEGEIGDEKFNQRFLIKSQPEALAKRALASQQIRQKLIALRSFRRIILFAGQLSWEKDGVVTQPEDFERALEVVVELANAIEDAGNR